jgi:hypothetical protein
VVSFLSGAELSCGYQCRLDPTPGIYEGWPYDVVQRDIRHDHVGVGSIWGWGRLAWASNIRFSALGLLEAATTVETIRREMGRKGGVWTSRKSVWRLKDAIGVLGHEVVDEYLSHYRGESRTW